MRLREVGGGWGGALKATVWTIVFAAVGLGLGIPLTLLAGALLGASGDGDWYTTPGLAQAVAQGVGLTLGFGVATFLIGRLALRRSWADLRWRTAAAPGPWFGKGLLLGLAAGLAALALGLAGTGARWVTTGDGWGAWGGAVAGTAAGLSFPALSEELMFRGLPLVLFAGVIGRWPAVLLMSLLFGLSHWTNPGVTALGLGNIGLAGVLLGVAFFAPGGIWTAWGTHLGWNLALAALGAPVSGLPLGIPHLAYQPGGPPWLTGGGFGPEGGLLATAAMAAAVAVAARWQRNAGEGTA